MRNFKEIINEKTFVRGSVFVIFNAFLLAVLYFTLKNFGFIADGIRHFLRNLSAAFVPLFIGLVIAYILNPLVNFIDRHILSKLFSRVPDDPFKAEKRASRLRFFSVLLAFLLVLSAIAAILYGFTAMILGKLIVTDFFTALHNLAAGFADYENTLKKWSLENLPEGFISEQFLQFFQSSLGRIFVRFGEFDAVKAVSGTVGSVINAVLGVVASIYLLKDKDFFLSLQRKLFHLILPQKVNVAVSEILNEINEILSQFLRSALLDALIVAIMSSAALSIIRLDFAVFIGILAGLFNIIPYFGPLFGIVPAFAVGFFTKDFWQGILAAAVLIVVQQLDSNVIYPKIVGSATGLHPLTVLLAVSILGYFGGILGMLLAVPTAGMIQVFVIKWACSRESQCQAVSKAAKKPPQRGS